jgi:ThiF family
MNAVARRMAVLGCAALADAQPMAGAALLQTPRHEVRRANNQRRHISGLLQQYCINRHIQRQGVSSSSSGVSCGSCSGHSSTSRSMVVSRTAAAAAATTFDNTSITVEPDDDWLQRSRLLVGPEGLEALARLNVLLVGLGGVGSFAAEFLARAGVGAMTIVVRMYDGAHTCISLTFSAHVTLATGWRTHLL